MIPPCLQNGALGCNGPDLRSHGRYTRKGTHGLSEPFEVPRWRCLDCDTTFGVLPPDILPICRAPLWLLKRLSGLLERGVSSAQIGRITGLSRGVISRIPERILSFGAALVSLSRAEGHLDGALDPDSLVDCLRLSSRRPWSETIYLLSRVVYPSRWATGPPYRRSTEFVHG